MLKPKLRSIITFQCHLGFENFFRFSSNRGGLYPYWVKSRRKEFYIFLASFLALGPRTLGAEAKITIYHNFPMPSRIRKFFSIFVKPLWIVPVSGEISKKIFL